MLAGGLFIVSDTQAQSEKPEQIRKAPAPLFRDPIFDGAADPVVFWNHVEKSWWMLYTQRRANVETADVAYCYGNEIGIASSDDNGRSWVYRGTLDLEFERGKNTFWAPEVIFHEGTYHLFVSYIPGVRNHWSGTPRLVHYTSRNLWDWKCEGSLKLLSDNVIDGTLFQMADGKWRIWYKDQGRDSVTMVAESTDLKAWKCSDEPAIGGQAHEGPAVFRLGEYYWMLTDEWAGMRIYRSADGNTWERQGRVLDKASRRPEDTPSGAHGDVVTVGDKAYVFYFTHPGRTSHIESPLDKNGNLPYALRRSSIQVAQLHIEKGTLVETREDFDFYLPNLN
ncbi:MAG: family 43 glycosylhydrolase [Anaerohalosphaeraceae bacterium]